MTEQRRGAVAAMVGVGVTLGGRAVLDGVDLELRAGEMLALIGPNGTGKSTALMALAGLHRPDRGTILCGEQRLDRLDRTERARRIGYLAQNPEITWPLTVAELVGLARLPWGDDRAGPSVGMALHQLGLSKLAHRRATTLSGGERALVHFARLLAGQPDILLADEPVAGLDPCHQLVVMELLRAWVRSEPSKRAVLVALHDLTLAARYGDRVAVLVDGGIRACGAPRLTMDAACLRHAYGVETGLFETPGGPSVSAWAMDSAICVE